MKKWGNDIFRRSFGLGMGSPKALLSFPNTYPITVFPYSGMTRVRGLHCSLPRAERPRSDGAGLSPRRERWEAVSGILRRVSPVFVKNKGIRDNLPRLMLRTALKAAKVPRVRFHDLCHSHRTPRFAARSDTPKHRARDWARRSM